MEDYVPSEWFSPLKDGSNIEGKFKTKRGLMAMKKGNLQVIFFLKTKIMILSCISIRNLKCLSKGSFTDFNVWDSFLSEEDLEEFTLCKYVECLNILTDLAKKITLCKFADTSCVLTVLSDCYVGQTWWETSCHGTAMIGR